VDPRYFVTVFTRSTWDRFVSTGGKVAGFKSNASGRVNRLVRGDLLLCYIVDGVGFVGILEVTGATNDLVDNGTWKIEDFPIQIPVQVVAELPVHAAVPMMSLIDQLPRLLAANTRQAGAWGGFIRGAPREWPQDEARVVVQALTERREQLDPRQPT